MANKLYEESDIQAIANAIRAKGQTGTMTVAQMPNKIAGIKTKSTYTWNQCPVAVKNYLANVTYDPSDYTTSQISNYAPASADPSNTKPIGKIIDGVTYYDEVPNVATPFSSTSEAGTLKPLDQVRWINSVTSNMRDLGGWNCDGGTVKYGLVYRSADINSTDKDLFVNLGITKELDLTADGVPAFAGIEYINTGTAPMYALTPTTAWKDNLQAIFNAAIYRQPIVFHCAMGADRTGTLACVIEGLLGVSQSDIDKDYELTSFKWLRARNGNYQGSATWANLIAAINALGGNTFRDKCVTFALSLGFTYDDINAFRSAMINGTPEPIVPPAPTNLFDKSDPDVVIRARLNSSGNTVAYADGQLATGFIPASVGDIIRLATDKDNKTNGYTGMVAFYDSNKVHIAQTGNASAYWNWEDGNLSGVCTIPQSVQAKDISATAYIRVCVAYTDIDSIVITK